MARRYYSSRNRVNNLTVEDLYLKLRNLYLLFRERYYFEGMAGITTTALPDAIQHEAALALSFQPFPITKWSRDEITEDHIFDTLEFLYDHVSKPDAWRATFDEVAGRSDFRSEANAFLPDFKPGFELTEEGVVVTLGADGVQHILNVEIVHYDESNVDSKVRDAIGKWRNRHSTLQDKKEAIRELADVFEWLKKTKRLCTVMDGKDESAIFDLANNFAIRHHNPKQKTNYDRAIWFSWIFHFYLATYHAAVRMLLKREKSEKMQPSSS